MALDESYVQDMGLWYGLILNIALLHAYLRNSSATTEGRS